MKRIECHFVGCKKDAEWVFSNGELYNENFGCTEHIEGLDEEEKRVLYPLEDKNI